MILFGAAFEPLVEDNTEVMAKCRMPVGFGREHLLLLPAIGSNDQAHAGQSYSTVGCGERADTVASEVGIVGGLVIPAHVGELG
jgi:hypothetical protein